MNTVTATLTAATDAAAIVVSTPPTAVPAEGIVIAWSRRSTAANPVKQEERYRGVVVHRALLALPDGATTSKFAALLQSTIHELAQARFQAWVSDGRMLEREMPHSVLALDNVLAYWAEEKQRATIDADKIKAWLSAAPTYAALTEAAKAVWMRQLPKMASPGYRNVFTKEQAATIVSKLAAEDLDHPVGVFVATRCNAIINEETQADAF